MKKRKNAIIALTISFIVVLSLFGTTAFAWFSMNTDVKTSSMNTHIEIFDAQAQYTVYLFDSKAGSVNYTGKNNDESDPTVTHLDVPFYDTIFKQRNRYTPVIIRVALTNVRLEQGIVNLRIDRDVSLSEPQSGGYFTDLMRFTVVKGTSLYSADADELYDNVDEVLFTPVQNGSYTPDLISNNNSSYYKGPSKIFGVRTYNEGSPVYPQGYVPFTVENYDYVNLSIPYGAADFVNGVFNFYLYITYDRTLLNSYTGFGNVSTIGQWVDMENDISKMEITFSSNS